MNTTFGTIARTETPTTRPPARTPRKHSYIHRPCDVEAHEYKAPDAYRKAARDDASSPLANEIHLASSLSRALHRSPVPQPCHRRASSPRARKRDMFTHHQRLTRAQPRTKTPHTTRSRRARQHPTTANRIVIIRRKTTTIQPYVYTRIGPFTTKLSSSPPSRTHTEPRARATTIYAPKHAMRDDDVDDDVVVLRAGFRAPTSRACAPRGTTHTECRRAPFRAPDDDADRRTEASTRW